MKFTSIIFTASESILEIYLTYTHKRARIMKFTSIIFTASESILEIYLTYTHKRARIMKFTSIIFTASEISRINHRLVYRHVVLLEGTVISPFEQSDFFGVPTSAKPLLSVPSDWWEYFHQVVLHGFCKSASSSSSFADTAVRACGFHLH